MKLSDIKNVPTKWFFGFFLLSLLRVMALTVEQSIYFSGISSSLSEFALSCLEHAIQWFLDNASRSMNKI